MREQAPSLTPLTAAFTFRRRVGRQRRVLSRVAAWLANSMGSEGPAARMARRLHRFSRDTEPPAIHVPSRHRSTRLNALLVSHDLSASGAPKVVVEIARSLIEHDFSVVVLSPEDGPFRKTLTELGAAVAIDRSALKGSSGFRRALVSASDVVIGNTVVAAGAVREASRTVSTFWYIHEISLLRTKLGEPNVQMALKQAQGVWAGSELSAELMRPYRRDVKVIPYGLEPIANNRSNTPVAQRAARIAIFGSFESRKGQDLALDAIQLLTPAERAGIRLELFGRILNSEFYEILAQQAAGLPEVTIHGELDEAGYRSAMVECDAVLVSSRDDTLPLVSLDALGAERILLCTSTTGTSAYLTNGVNGFIAARPDAHAIAAMLSDALAHRSEWPVIAAAGRSTFSASFSKGAFARALISEIGPAVSLDRAAP